ncbi:MAG: GHKL domain-containing protein, partial [Bacteroidales bacterium]|nr:GHKL domain-containing protein [Bacteroidales bacterium]
KLLNSLADAAAKAVENVQLIENLEKKVNERTSQLQVVNKELETFTYSVSHDLKAPLRGIDGYSKLLYDLYKPNLNKEAQYFIETIRSSTLQMNQLIDDLLSYSRLERSQLTRERIKIKDFVKSVLSIYNADLEVGNFKIIINIADVELIADPKGLTIALRNLIENALKFTRGRAEPSIQVEVEEKDLSWIISVNDNGIGFDMQYHQKIFEIFQRLQRVEDFPGTGIGLAMVSKAMHRMQGRVWAESTPGMGSTFYLEIPKNQ